MNVFQPVEWRVFPARQVTGDPYRFIGYVGREVIERPCCDRRHSKYSGQQFKPIQRAMQCAEKTAKRLNRAQRAGKVE